MSPPKSEITIAVIGGGLGGVCAALALGQAGYAVRLFEQAPELGEIGAGLAVSSNSLRALAAISPEVARAYEKLADIEEEGSPFVKVYDWDHGEHKFDVLIKGGPNSYASRRRVLEALQPFLPTNVTTEFSAHITRVENVPGTAARAAHVRLIIEPSRRHRDTPGAALDAGAARVFEADAVVGCDGVKSIVRACVGARAASGAPAEMRYTGTYIYRGLVDMGDAVRAGGERVRSPMLLCGPSAHFITYPVEKRRVCNIGVFVSDRSRPADERVWSGPWVQPVDTQAMLDDFAGWDESALDVLKLIKEPKRWALHEALPLDHWTQGRITLLGDSAHASLPHNGAGAGQAIEDAYVLGELLRLPACTKETIPAFLQAYEAVRRPRASRQQEHARESGELFEFASPLGGDWEKIAGDMPHRFDWIWTHDLVEDVEKAKEQLQAQGLL